MNACIRAKKRHEELYRLYHLWYRYITDPEIHGKSRRTCAGLFVDYPNIYKAAERDIRWYDLKPVLYKELRQLGKKKMLACRKYSNIKRLSVFSVIFYNQTHVDMSFAKRKLLNYLN